MCEVTIHVYQKPYGDKRLLVEIPRLNAKKLYCVYVVCSYIVSCVQTGTECGCV